MPRSDRFPRRVLLASALAFAVAPAVCAAEPDPHDEWSVSLGAFRAITDTTISARAGAGGYHADGSFNLEDDLGLDDRTPVGLVRFDRRITPDQSLSLEYFGFDRENEVGITRRIVYDGYTYEASASVRGRLDYDFGSAAWHWWFGDGATRWGLGAGVAYYRVDTLLAGEASFDGETVQASSRSSDAAFAPMAELAWRHAFSDRLRGYATLSGVAKDGGALHGHVIEAAVGLEWFPWRRVGFALEYGQTEIRLVRDRDHWDAKLDLKLRGPSLLLRLR